MNLGPDDVKYVAECVSHGEYFTVKMRRLLRCACAFACAVRVRCSCGACAVHVPLADPRVRLEGRRRGVRSMTGCVCSCGKEWAKGQKAKGHEGGCSALLRIVQSADLCSLCCF
jgi:hypothetical protein